METRTFSLDSKYLQEEGTILLSGVQALVRLPLDQHRADKQAGLNTATFISGYRGSPLGGLDILLAREKKLLDAHQVVFMPGVNEDLGATAVFGSQLANLLPQPKYDGVLGMWYGKAPGVDRSGDIFKHANFAGVGRYGGVLAVAGDDPISKSSTLPSHSEIALYDAQMPILYPGTVQEVIEYGRYGFELSRYSGAWVGLKVVTNVADSFETAVIRPITQIIHPEFSFNGKGWQHSQNPVLVAPYSVNLEREIHEGRLTAAKLFAAANNLNQITVHSENDWIGLVAAGKTYYDVREALQQLGLSDEDLHQHGIRLLKIGMLYPLEPTAVRQFARGLQEIFVIEEKRGFLELLIRDVLYNLAERPIIVGKQDENDHFLTPGHAELDPDLIAQLLLKRLSSKIPNLQVPSVQLSVISNQLPIVSGQLPTRTFHFCSGCPHNRSTLVPDGSIAGGGIGCHGMALVMDRNTQGITHMGGEGVQWVGASHFSHMPHMFQNLGDGTLFHSGYLAIRQAIAAKTNITYKILYNSAVPLFLCI
jgi:indolepyruvate ferredoxin oxidoreductase